MELINLTPHIINIVVEGNTSTIDIAPSGVVARCSQSNVQMGVVDFDGVQIPVTRQEFGEVVDLPEEKTGVRFIVSRLVAAACPNRHDLVIPGPLVRDDNGRPIGCQGLSTLL